MAEPGTALTRNHKAIYSMLALTVLFSVLTSTASNYHLYVIAAISVVLIALLMLKHIHLSIFLLAIYFPFEEMILKYLPVSDNVFSALRYAPEVLIYVLCVLVISQRIWQRSLKKTPLDLPLLLFVGVSLLSALVNQCSLLETALFLRAILRYAFLYYIVANVKLSDEFIKKLIVALIIVGLAQVAIGFTQLVIGDSFNKALTPRSSTLSVDGFIKGSSLPAREKGSIWGTTGDTINLSSFLLLTLSFSVSSYLLRKEERLKRFFLLAGALLFLGISFTYSRGLIFSGLLVFLVSFVVERKIKVLTVCFVVLGLIVIFFTPQQILPKQLALGHESTPYTHFLESFTPNYRKAASHDRLYIVNAATHETIIKKPLLGFGPTARINNPHFHVLGDVYWINILFKIGLMGLISLLLVFWELAKASLFVLRTHHSKTTKILSLSILTFITSICFYNFFAPVMELRTMSLYFWLFAGVLVLFQRQAATKSCAENSQCLGGRYIDRDTGAILSKSRLI